MTDFNQPPNTSNQDVPPDDNFDAGAFLSDLGIESLSDRMVRDHEGTKMPLAEAVATCLGARDSIAAAATLVKSVAGENADVAAHVGGYLETMEKQAEQATGQVEQAKKK